MTYETKSMLYFIHILHVRSAARGLRKNAKIPDVTNTRPERSHSYANDRGPGHKGAPAAARGALVGDIRRIIVLRVETSLSTK